jgi:hypothetical protein
MANTQAVSTSFKNELFLGEHQFGTATLVSRGSLTAPTTDTIMAALYVATGSQGAGTTAYATTNELTGTGYTAGGVTVTNATAPTTSGTTAYWTPSANLSWTGLTSNNNFDCVTFYNSTQSNKAIASYTFGSQGVTSGNFTLTMPTNDSTHALLRLA